MVGEHSEHIIDQHLDVVGDIRGLLLEGRLGEVVHVVSGLYLVVRAVGQSLHMLIPTDNVHMVTTERVFVRVLGRTLCVGCLSFRRNRLFSGGAGVRELVLV